MFSLSFLSFFSGIGLESAILFAKEGAKVVCCDVNDTSGNQTARKIQELLNDSNAAVFVKVDVSKESEIAHAVQVAEQTYGKTLVIDRLGKLNVIFNNAGIMHPNDDNAMTTDEKVWDLTMNINVKGVWYGCKYGIPALRRAGGGSIINTASFVALMGAATPQLACKHDYGYL
jgi:NAD(P)-dependent dehydrogenase (short-subunit alcohol dehydrogenase family)